MKLMDTLMSEVYQRKGTGSRRRGSLHEATKYYEKSIEKNPNNAGAHYDLGRCYITLAKFTESEKEYKKALQLNPDNELVWMDLGTLCLLYGKDSDLKQDRREEGLWYDEIGKRIGELNDIDKNPLKMQIKEIIEKYSNSVGISYVEFDESNNISFIDSE